MNYRKVINVYHRCNNDANNNKYCKTHDISIDINHIKQ